MATTLLRRAKLLRPRPADDLIPRQRLLDRLNGRPCPAAHPAQHPRRLRQDHPARPVARRRPAALRLARARRARQRPAHLRRRGRRRAARRSGPRPGRETLGLLHLPATPPPDYLGAALADELLDLPGPALLVLDDYHAVDDPAAHAFVAALLEYPPPDLRLALASARRAAAAAGAPAGARPGDRAARARPGLHARGGAGVPGARGRRAGRPGGGGGAGAARTEGWAVGLRLAALALRDGGRPGARGAGVRRAAPAARHGLPARRGAGAPAGEVQAFLLRTSVVERVCGPLAEALLGAGARARRGRGDAGAAGRRQPVRRGAGGRRRRAGVGALSPAVPGAAARAAGAGRGAGGGGRACTGGRRTGSPDAGWSTRRSTTCWRPASRSAAARLVEGRVEAVLDREDWGTLWRWLGRLPDELTRRRPGLLLAHAVVDFIARPGRVHGGAAGGGDRAAGPGRPGARPGRGGGAARPGGRPRGGRCAASVATAPGRSRPGAARCRRSPTATATWAGTRGSRSGWGCTRWGGATRRCARWATPGRRRRRAARPAGDARPGGRSSSRPASCAPRGGGRRACWR